MCEKGLIFLFVWEFAMRVQCGREKGETGDVTDFIWPLQTAHVHLLFEMLSKYSVSFSASLNLRPLA